MNHFKKIFIIPSIIAISLSCSSSLSLAAPVVPSTADTGRILSDRSNITSKANSDNIYIPRISYSGKMPKDANSTFFNLKKVTIKGMTKFTEKDFKKLYSEDIGENVSLEILWKISSEIAQKYHEDGYFLTKVFVPQQKIANGDITIEVVEGYINHVEIEGDLKKNKIVQRYIKDLLSEKPSNITKVESFLLLMQDIPGYEFRSIFTPYNNKNEDDPAVKLSLIVSKKLGAGSVSIDNFASRFFGPQEITASYSKSLIPFQQSTITGMSNLSDANLKYLELKHSALICPKLNIGASGSYVKGHPVYTLESLDIQSETISTGLNANYQMMRSRDKNLVYKLNLDVINSRANYYGGTPLTRDIITVVRTGLTYDFIDKWNGSNSIT